MNQIDQNPAATATALPPAGPDQRAPLTPNDPAVQAVESAHQILTMIGANPRAIRPIMAQRRLTKEMVMESTAWVAPRAESLLANLETLAASRRATYEQVTADLQARVEAEDSEEPRAKLAAANAAWSKFQTQYRAQQEYLSGLIERTARVAEVYGAF